MNDYQKYLDSAIIELKRGGLVLAVLNLLKEPKYGYSLMQTMAARGYVIDQSTLYPLLRRLEQQGFLNSNWSVEETRPRKYYQLSEDGSSFLADLKDQWKKNTAIIDGMID